ncbi:phenylacetate-coenzyme A ligase [mine drainage metagenome]|uniref:Phenylacetate-coenzyme A ligase n=1 Tax=mine drainage metagenome TaxID=410659 RepID=A0A1J5QQ18_9ZZZZ
MLPTFDPWLSAVVAADVASCTYLAAQRLAALRARRLAALLRAAARGSPLYRRILQGRDLAMLRLEDLPMMSKAKLMRNFHHWVADPEVRLAALRRFTADRGLIAESFLGRYMVWESSGGSGGEPGVFVQDATAMAVYDALEAIRRILLRPQRRLLDPCYLGERIVFVGATSGHFASTVSVERLRRLNPLLAHHLRSVSFLQPLGSLVAELDALQPTIVATYPSAAVLLAEERQAGRLRIAPLEIWTGGENLRTAMRGFIEQAFNCPVVNSYGASEFLSLASQCRFGALHLNSDWAILESIDEHGRPLPTGSPGASVLLTNLANHVQPLIRYDLADRVTLHSAACACGSSLPVIEVQGRRDDTLRLAAGVNRTISVLPLALTTVLEEDAGLFDFQLIQQGPSELTLCTRLRGEPGAAALERGKMVLSAYLEWLGASGVRIHCRSGKPTEPGASGKVRRVVAMVGRK